MKNKEINKLTNDEMLTKLNKFKKDLFNMRFKRTNGPLEDTSKFSMINASFVFILFNILLVS